jgi:Arc/MetJ-type ribon-helix-helix transcriptional regulator
MNSQTKVVATRVTPQLAELIKEICRRDAHVNPADFIRDAVREKIQRDAPELYRELFNIGKVSSNE